MTTPNNPGNPGNSVHRTQGPRRRPQGQSTPRTGSAGHTGPVPPSTAPAPNASRSMSTGGGSSASTGPSSSSTSSRSTSTATNSTGKTLCALLTVAVVACVVFMNWYKVSVFDGELTREGSLFGNGFPYGWVMVVIAGLTLLGIFNAIDNEDAGFAACLGGIALFIAAVVSVFAKKWILGLSDLEKEMGASLSDIGADVSMASGFWIALLAIGLMIASPLYADKF